MFQAALTVYAREPGDARRPLQARAGSSASNVAEVALTIRSGEVGAEAASIQLASRRSFEIRAAVRITSPDEITYGKSVRIPANQTGSVEFPEDFGVEPPLEGEYDVRVVTRARGEETEVHQLAFVLG
jgi:hypothetical protein